MKDLLDAFWRAAAYCLHLRVILALAAVAAVLALACVVTGDRETDPILAASAPVPRTSKVDHVSEMQVRSTARANGQPVALKVALPQLPKTPLQSLIDNALKPGTGAEDRALALHLMETCLFSYSDSFPVPTTLEDVKDLNGGVSIDAKATLKDGDQARKQIAAFCATGNATELMDRLKQANLPAFGPIEKALVLWRRGGPRSQEYFQAATQVLANPGGYPVQFDTWLSRDLDTQLRETYGLSRNQSVYVQDSLYNGFVAEKSAQAFRLTERCARFALCPSSTTLSDLEANDAQRVAARLQLAIQQQRWDSLIPHK